MPLLLVEDTLVSYTPTTSKDNVKHLFKTVLNVNTVYLSTEQLFEKHNFVPLNHMDVKRV